MFSGVGSFGLECLSREANAVTFIENYKTVIPILKKNISNLNVLEKSKIIEKDILNKLNFNNLNSNFDIIFLISSVINFFKKDNIKIMPINADKKVGIRIANFAPNITRINGYQKDENKNVFNKEKTASPIKEGVDYVKNTNISSTSSIVNISGLR